MSMVCEGCDYRKNSSEGLCLRKKSSDGLIIRCVGVWSEAKHYYLKRYLGTFTKAMRKKWKNICFIDLFAGPGKCRVRNTGQEIEGSPLIALNIRYPFSKYFFVDLSEEAIEGLTLRLQNHQHYNAVTIKQGDANEQVQCIINNIPEKSLSIAFIDPTGLHFKFPSLKKLTTRRIDLIYTFPTGMALSRNIAKFLKSTHCVLDDVIGDKEWRQYKTERGIIKYFKGRLQSLGYVAVKSGDEIPIRSADKKLPLYSLLFASKHKLGHKFWNEIGKINHRGQRRLF